MSPATMRERLPETHEQTAEHDRGESAARRDAERAEHEHEGPTHSARRRWCVKKRPSGTSATIRAKPKAPATMPSCQSASAALRAMSGRTAGKAPLETRLEKVVRQSRAVRDVTRPLW